MDDIEEETLLLRGDADEAAKRPRGRPPKPAKLSDADIATIVRESGRKNWQSTSSKQRR